MVNFCSIPGLEKIDFFKIGKSKEVFLCSFQIMIDYISKAVFMHEKVSRAFKHKLSSNKPIETEDAAIWRDARYGGNPVAAPNAQSAALLSSNTSDRLSPNANDNRSENTIETRLRKMEALVSKVKISTPGSEERDYDVRILRIQWRNIAIVMDRCFFALYALTIIITTSIIFPKPE